MSSQFVVNPNSLSHYTTQNLQVPCEGPTMVPVPMDFGANLSYLINLQNFTALLRMSLVQAVYIDNADNAAQIVLTVQGSGQRIIMGPNKQGYRNILCPNPVNIVVASTGGVTATVILLNFPVTNAEWTVV